MACAFVFVLPVELFPAVAIHLERVEDVFALCLSCKGAAKGLTETREPLVAWIVARCLQMDDPLTSALALMSRNGLHECVDVVLAALVHARRDVSACDAVRALCHASGCGYERAVAVLLAGAAPLSGAVVAAPCAGAAAAAAAAAALVAAVHDKVVLAADCVDAPVTRLEAAYRALLETRSRRVAARLLDWAPEVDPEHVHFGRGRAHSLLHVACGERSAGVVLEVLARRDAGARHSAGDRDDAARRDTPLSLACELDGEDAESLAIVRALLDAGAWHSPRVDFVDRTPLHLAAGAGSAGAVRMLLDAGADASARHRFGSTPLHVACGADVARALLGAGALPSCLDQLGRSPLHCAGDAGAARALLDAGADPNAGDNRGAGPLHLCAEYRDAARGDVIGTLLAAGADPDMRDARGRTPLHSANTAAAVEVLAAAGATLDARDARGRTPLMDAILHIAITTDFRFASRHEKVVEALATAGADPLARGQHGAPALAAVCANLYYEADRSDNVRARIIDTLALSPALTSATHADTLDAQGRTPLDLARDAGLKACEAALLKEPWAQLWEYTRP
jgi:ankyrin repeat protein